MKRTNSKSKITTKKVVSKAKKAATKTGEFVGNNPKTTLYLVLGTVGIYVGYKIYKSISNKFNPNIDDEVTSPNTPTPNATITKVQASNFAQQLLDAMNKNRNSFILGGTDENIIEAVFDKLKNGDDFILVARAFGKKEYNGYNSPVEGFEFLDTFTPRNLVYWLNSEISSFWNPTLFRKIKERVESAGFTF